MATRYAARDLTISIDGAPAVQLLELGAVGSSRSLIDATAFGDDWASYVSGIQDGDELNFRFAYDPAETAHQDFIDTYEGSSGTVTTFTIEHEAAGFAVDVSAIITAMRRGGEINGLLEMSGTAKIVDPGVVDAS